MINKEKLLLQAKLQNFSQEDLLGFIPKEIINNILKVDKHPFFQAYSIAHEGISKSKVLGIGGKIIKWSREAIKKTVNAVKAGIECFYKHNTNNSKDNRKKIGEVVASFEKEINGKLNSLIITYHPPEQIEIAKKCDVVSQESEWYFEDKNNILEAIEPIEITAIAFDNSNENKPAFEGAVRLGMIQCFEDDKDEGGKPSEQNKKEKYMTFEDIKKGKTDLNVFASQLYSLDEIKKDRAFAEVFEKYEAEIKKLQKEKEEKEKEIEKFKNIEKENLKLTQKNRLEEILKKENIILVEDEKKFIFDEESLKRNEDPTDEGLKKFLLGRREDYKLYQKINSKEPEVPTDKPNVNNTDYSKPENNEFI